MVSDRPYRERLTEDQALEELRRYSGRHFDPEVVEVFVRVIERDQAEAA
jgi:response regulator RpfG family c-di-GMP phosphodiesterase